VEGVDSAERGPAALVTLSRDRVSCMDEGMGIL
jgi:hypothetical protein